MYGDSYGYSGRLVSHQMVEEHPSSRKTEDVEEKILVLKRGLKQEICQHIITTDCAPFYYVYTYVPFLCILYWVTNTYITLTAKQITP